MDRRPAWMLLLLALAFASCRGNADLRLETVDGRRVAVDRLERTYARVMEKARIPAISCAVLNGGEIVYVRTFGVKSAETGEPADEQTLFAGASFSKPLFAYLVLLLVENGELVLDQPLEEYLGDRLANDPHYADLAGDLRTTRITARQALSHTIGFPNWRFLTDDGRLRLEFEPGARFSYSGEGFALLQRVVEKQTGRGLEELARERIFDPLGMRRSSYVWRPGFEDNHAVPHDEFARPRRLGRRREAGAAGSLVTTAGDYARFIAELLEAEGRRRETVESMLALQVPIESRGMFGPAARETSSANNAIRLGWSLGWGRFETGRRPAIFHTAHDFGWQGYTVTHLAPGTGIVLLANSNNFESVARELVAATLGEEGSPFDWLGYPRFDPAALRRQPPETVVVDVPAEVLRRYVGDYTFRRDRVLSFKLEGGRLFVAGGDGGWTELAATSETEFFVPGAETAFRFEPAPGRPPKLVVVVEGLEMPARPLAEALAIPELEPM